MAAKGGPWCRMSRRVVVVKCECVVVDKLGGRPQSSLLFIEDKPTPKRHVTDPNGNCFITNTVLSQLFTILIS